MSLSGKCVQECPEGGGKAAAPKKKCGAPPPFSSGKPACCRGTRNPCGMIAERDWCAEARGESGVSQACGRVSKQKHPFLLRSLLRGQERRGSSFLSWNNSVVKEGAGESVASLTVFFSQGESERETNLSTQVGNNRISGSPPFSTGTQSWRLEGGILFC